MDITTCLCTISDVGWLISMGKRVSMHYSDVIKGAMASQITGLTIVNDTGADQRKHQSSASPACLFAGNSPMTGEFLAQMANNAENVSI